MQQLPISTRSTAVDIDLDIFLAKYSQQVETEVEPLPVPEAIESNDDSVWAMWEDSVSFQDSLFESRSIATR